jgi:hypothetical protein
MWRNCGESCCICFEFNLDFRSGRDEEFAFLGSEKQQIPRVKLLGMTMKG